LAGACSPARRCPRIGPNCHEIRTTDFRDDRLSLADGELDDAGPVQEGGRQHPPGGSSSRDNGLTTSKVMSQWTMESLCSMVTTLPLETDVPAGASI
jgi:hypothetical protein